MRKVVSSVFLTLDGVMQAPGGPDEDRRGGFSYGGWTWPYGDEVFGQEVTALFAQPFDLLLGRKTYDIFAAYWPHVDSGEHSTIARTFNAATKHVATRTQMSLDWQGSVILHDAARDVARLKSEAGPTLLTQGSGDLLQTLLEHDLIDELVLFTFPIVLGTGRRLFGPGTRPAAFEMVSGRVSPKGIVSARYRRNGQVRTEDHGLKPPPQAELDRRDRLLRDG